MNTNLITLDLREMHPIYRHDKIFEFWEKMTPGEVLQIINDHNPKPLHYQFEAEQKGKYEWGTVEEGPKDWIVNIKRI
ncbi:MAG: DUF2249 domain-containing protein [Firmicutes bacterium]|nr:DUF2249 domain-containing protein [Bacillota bacterium]